jgi:uncharacterized protein YfaP (DUF2135 family)
VAAGGATTTTNAQGRFSLPGVPVSAFATLSVSAATYMDQFKPVETLATGATTTVPPIPMLKVAFTETFPGNTARTVQVPGSTASVTLPANALVGANGAAAASVTALLTPISPAGSVDTMPGNYTARRADGSVASIETFGALDLRFRDAQGAPLNLAPGQSATVRIPLSSSAATPPATVPLFYFDAATGRWVQDGTASLTGTAPNRFYQGTITRVATWNADALYSSVDVTGCVVNAAGTAVANALVKTEGRDYTGTGTARTDAQGRFVVPMKAQASAFVQASADGQISNARPVTATTTTLALPSPCLTLATADVSVRRTWGTQPFDVDSYLRGPQPGDRVWFGAQGNLTQAPFAALDVDDIDSFGPEIVTISRLARNRTYRYYVNNFSQTFTPGLTGSPVKVELTVRGQLRTFTPPAGEGGNLWWSVFDLEVGPDCSITVNPIQAWSPTEPVTPNTGAVTALDYCQ